MNLQTKQIPFDLGHRPAQGREDFMVAPSNQEAVGWLDRWPSWGAPCLIIYGPAASGKSHLASVWAVKTNAILVNNRCLANTDASELADLGKHLVIDNADLWLGDRGVETTFFHLYNIMKEEQRSFLMTMTAAPTHIDFSIADLASRLRAAPAAAIQPPDDTLLAALLVKLFSDRQLKISSDVLQYLLPRMERSFAAAHELVRSIDHHALSEKKAISTQLVRRVLLEQQEINNIGSSGAAND